MRSFAGAVRGQYRGDGLEVVETSYGSGQHVPAHSHDRPMIIVVLTGTMQEHVLGRNVHCSPGEVLFHPSGEAHEHRFEPPESRCLSLQMSKNWLDRLEVEEGGIPDGPTNRSGFVSEVAGVLHSEFRRGEEALSATIDGLALRLLVSLSKETAPIERGRPAFLGRVLEQLHDDPSADIDLSSLARLARVSPEHLARTFQRCQGMTIGAYTRALRVERARVALAAGEASLARLALQLGFYDQAHFTRVFKAHVGCPPGEYRRRMS